MAGKLVSNFVFALANILDWLIGMYLLVVLVAVVASWLNADPYNPIVRFLRSTTEPVFSWIRRRLPFVIAGSLDLSPLVLTLALLFVRWFLVPSLHDLAFELR
jgi:YggT family protein